MKEFFKNLWNYKLQILLQIFFYIVAIFAIYKKATYFHEVTELYNVEQLDILFISILGCVFILTAVIFFISFNITKWFMLGVNILVSIIILVDIIYAKYYSGPITITVMFYQFKLLGDIKDSTSALFNFNDLIVFADIPFLILMCIFIKEPKGIKWWTAKGIVALLLLILGQNLFVETFKSSNVSKFLWEKRNLARELGVLYHHYDDIKSTANKISMQKKLLTQKEIDDIEFYKYHQSENEYTNIAEGKNLLLIQLEAIQTFVINAKIKGVEVTPNLNKLIKNSIYANNLYYQTGYGNTSDAEFIANNSLYPSTTGPVYYEYPSNTYYSIANILNKQNYYTASFHGFEANFWNRVEMYSSLGFQKYYSQNDFKPEKIIGFGIGDKEFFEQSIEYLLKDSNGNSFYGFLVALSSHHPYTYFNDINLDVGEYEGTMLGNYLKGANYVDNAIGNMIEFMKEKGIYDNTVIAMYGDHAGLFNDEANNLCKYLGIEYNKFNWHGLQKVPFILSIPGLNKKVEINEPSGQIDILPTIANIMGIDIPYMYGKDLLNDDYGYVVLPNNNIITENFIFSIEEHNFYDSKTKELLKETEELVEEARYYYRRKNLSNFIIERNALKKVNRLSQ